MNDECLGEEAELFLTKIAAHEVLTIDPNESWRHACALLTGLDLEKRGLVTHEIHGNVGHFRFTPKGFEYFHGQPAKLN